MTQYLFSIWTLLLAALQLAMCVVVSMHVILHKRQTRAAIGWLGVIWLTPYLGSMLYLLFGINRIQRRAQRLRAADAPSESGEVSCVGDVKDLESMPDDTEHLHSLAQSMAKITELPLLRGNKIEILPNGDACFPAMLSAIDGARESVALSTYIFDMDRSGKQFLAALKRAVERGVEVRVLIDSVGSRYWWPTAVGSLRQANVPVAAFIPTLVPWRFPYANLRNHRKILVVDGRIGFTGGINIREGNVQALQTKHPIQDMHFCLEGPVVAHLRQVFAEDWFFCTDESLQGPEWFPLLEERGNVLARGVADGPDEDFDRIRLSLLAALACARRRVTIVTPYFLPDNALATALNVAALRGVQVDILLPAQNNLALVEWAMMAEIWEVLERGCRVWLTPPPFDHSKMMLVDDYWSIVGSANWDPRSLRLNFEFNVECYDAEFARSLGTFVDSRLKHSRQLHLSDVRQRSLPIRLRDGIARLAKPYI